MNNNESTFDSTEVVKFEILIFAPKVGFTYRKIDFIAYNLFLLDKNIFSMVKQTAHNDKMLSEGLHTEGVL